MNRSQARILKLTSGIVGLSFALITASVGTVAWFMANSRNKVSGIDIEAADGIQVSNIYTLNTKVDASGLATTTPQKTDGTTEYKLHPYDRAFADNDYNNSILHIQLDIPTGIDTSAEETFVTIFSSTTELCYKNYVGNVTSNLAGFKIYPYSYKLLGESSFKKIDSSVGSFTATETATDYEPLKSIFEGMEYSVAFVSNNSNGRLNRTNNVNNIVSIKGNNYQAISLLVSDQLLGTSEHVITGIDFYLEVQYKESFVRAFMSNADPNLSSLVCTPDIPMMKIDKGEKTNGFRSSGQFVKILNLAQHVDGKYLVGCDVLDDETSIHILDARLADSSSSIKENNSVEEGKNENNIALNSITQELAFSIEKTSNEPTELSYTIRHNDNYIGKDYSLASLNPIDSGKFGGVTSKYFNSFKYSNGILDADISVPVTEKLYTLTYSNRYLKFGYYDYSSDRTNLKKVSLYRYLENASTLFEPESIALRINGDSVNLNYYVTNPLYSCNENQTAYKNLVDAIITYKDGTRSLVSADSLTFSINGVENANLSTLVTKASPVFNGNVSVSYTEGDFSVSPKTYPITVKYEKTLFLSVNTSGGTLEFNVGDNFSCSGIVVNATKNCGIESHLVSTTLPSTLYDVSTPDMSSSGTKTVTITDHNDPTIYVSYSIEVGTPVYQKVTSDQTDWRGRYIIGEVYNSTLYVFDGSLGNEIDSNYNYLTMTSSDTLDPNYVIDDEEDLTLDDVSFTIDYFDGNHDYYRVCADSQVFIGGKTGDNILYSNYDTPYKIVLGYSNSHPTIRFANGKSFSYLKYRSDSSAKQYRFRFYSEDKYNALTLFKLTPNRFERYRESFSSYLGEFYDEEILYGGNNFYDTEYVYGYWGFYDMNLQSSNHAGYEYAASKMISGFSLVNVKDYYHEELEEDVTLASYTNESRNEQFDIFVYTVYSDYIEDNQTRIEISIHKIEEES